MVAEKTLRFEKTNTDLGRLKKDLTQKLIAEGYNVQSSSGSNSYVIQAKKEGVLRDIIAANRAFTIMVNGKPNSFNVRVGIGKFVQNLAVTAVEALALTDLFLVVDVPEMLWTKHVEDDIIMNIKSTIGKEPVEEKFYIQGQEAQKGAKQGM